MKIGVSYNVFDGEELLEASIKSIRQNVDYINIVYQTTSNFGNKCSDELLDVVNDLKNKGLVEELFLYEPDLKRGAWNETKKRRIGLSLCKKQKCTHFLNMDTDEFYEDKQFKYAKDIVQKEKIGASACRIYYYMTEPIYRGVSVPNNHFAPFLFSVNFLTVINKFMKYKFSVDPTRRVGNLITRTYFRNPKLFEEHELMMHHMSFIRKDISKKWSNTSHTTSRSLAKEKTLELLNWKYDKSDKSIIKVKNQFNIDISEW